MPSSALKTGELPEIATKDAIKQIAIDMLQMVHRGTDDEKLRELANQALIEETGAPFLEYSRMPSIALFGPPGEGKTTAFKEAAKLVGNYLGLKVVFNPGNGFTPTKEHLVLNQQEMSGVVSNIDFGGLPTKATETVDGEAYDYLKKILEKRITQMRLAAFAVLVFDDFPNASTFIQNNLLSLIEEKRYQGLDLGLMTYTGLTGNEGAKDGTHTGKPSSATFGRIRPFRCKEPMADFIQRTEAETIGHPYADGGIIGFLETNADLYSNKMKPGHQGGFPSPRTFTSLIETLRRARHYFGLGVAGGKEMRNEKLGMTLDEFVRTNATSQVGPEVGAAVADYMYSVMTSAEPLAEAALSKDGLTESQEKLLNDSVGDGHSAAATSFTLQFVYAAAEKAAYYYSQAKDRQGQTDVVRRFGKAVFGNDLFKNKALGQSLHRFTRRVHALVPDVRGKQDQTVLSEEAVIHFTAEICHGAGGVPEDFAEDVTAILAGSSLGNRQPEVRRAASGSGSQSVRKKRPTA